MNALRQAQTDSSKPVGFDAELWEDATPEQQLVLKRIAKQRSRLQARSAARAQAQTLQTQAHDVEQVQSDAPLVDRVITFVRLHPIATAVAGASLMAVGPRKLMRWGSIALPWILKLQQRGRS
ncbi:MAG: hypothetical protein LBE30_13400 [Comamonas sp.]|jgi:hypothetical protein|nr:hypothetical protein [Comamonas sp.]